MAQQRQHRTLQVVRDHLSQPGPARGPDALARAVRMEDSHGILVRDLANEVGGLGPLEALDDEPVPDEPFDWSVVTADDRSAVEAVVERVERVGEPWFDAEYRTIARRFLRRVLEHDPGPLRRSSRPDRIAAGVVLAVLDGNGEVGPRLRWRAGDIGALFGMSSPGDVARRLVAAASFVVAYPDERWWAHDRGIRLRSADLLHSRRRRWLIERRERARAGFEAAERDRAGRRPLVDLGDGVIGVRACPADAALVHKGLTASGQVLVSIAFAPVEPDPDLSVYALSVPEAYRLAEMLDDALAEPVPRWS